MSRSSQCFHLGAREQGSLAPFRARHELTESAKLPARFDPPRGRRSATRRRPSTNEQAGTDLQGTEIDRGGRTSDAADPDGRSRRGRSVAARTGRAYLYAKATNGYSAQLKSEGDKLQLTLSRGLFPGLVYTFHGRVSAAGIRARIADLGTVNLNFKLSGKVRHGGPPAHCSGPRATQVEGHFVGEFDFRAEGGVTKIDLTSAKGSLAAPGWHCHEEGLDDFLQRAPSGSTYTFLQAIDQGHHLGFSAFTGVDPEHPESHGDEISASERTRRGPVTVDHLAIVLAVNVFDFDSALTTATVSPPSPFRGSATYCRNCESGSQWTGDLSVHLPGLDRRVALADPGYRAGLRSLVGGGRSE